MSAGGTQRGRSPRTSFFISFCQRFWHRSFGISKPPLRGRYAHDERMGPGHPCPRQPGVGPWLDTAADPWNETSPSACDELLSAVDLVTTGH